MVPGIRMEKLFAGVLKNPLLARRRHPSSNCVSICVRSTLACISHHAWTHLENWRKGGALQAAEKLVWRVIPRSRRRRGISHWLENTQSEIPRSARNDSLEGFFRSL